MTTTHRVIAQSLLTAAALAGLAGDLLLRSTPWGANFSLWTIGLIGTLVLLSRRTGVPLPAGSTIVLVASALCAAFFTLRDSDALGFWNFCAAFLGIGLAASRSARLATIRILDIIHAFLHHALHGLAGCGFLLYKDLRTPPGDSPARRLPWGALARGTALALPPVLLFGALLTSADATFEYVVKEVLQIDFWTIVGHVLLFSFLAWTIAGVLRGRFIAQPAILPEGLRPKGLAAGILELGILLGTLDLMFMAFVALQFPYFFGGHDTVMGTPSLTYAEYARRGFFELVTVAVLALPMLLCADWFLRKERPKDALILRCLSGVMALLLLLMLASAAQRLWIYADTYGLTQSRVQAAAVLVWLALTILWFASTVLRGLREKFAFGSIVAGYAVLIGLNLVNPDDLVVRANLSRAESGSRFDAGYAGALSADAVPALVAGVKQLAPEDRDRCVRQLFLRFGPTASPPDWRSWNLSRAAASSLVRQHRNELTEMMILKPGETGPDDGR